jgi:hypothetical protein
MMKSIMKAALAVIFVQGLVSAQGKEDETMKAYHAAFEKKDHAALVEVWKKNGDAALGTIDSDLEGSLAMIEKDGDKADAAEIKMRRERAMFGAKAADEAFGTNIFSDYTSSFAGWTADEQKNFRGGQKAHGEGRQALQKKDFAAAMEAGKKCADLASNLGDWWGWAMGLGVMAEAAEQTGDLDAAAKYHALARRIYHDLHLSGSEVRNAVGQTRVLIKQKKLGRAAASHATALALATRLGSKRAIEELTKLAEELSAK